MVQMKDGHGKTLRAVPTNGRQTGLGRTRLARELFADRYRPGQSLQLHNIAAGQGMDLEVAKDVQRAFFPPQSLSIPCLSCETFYKPARGVGGDYYDFLFLQEGGGGIAICSV